MPTVCSYCRGPVHGAGLLGRPWPGRAAQHYCCYGCLSLGEQDCQEGCARPSEGGKFDFGAVRLALAMVIAGQSMIFALGINLEDAAAGTRLAVQGAILGATLLVLALLGWPLFREAGRELRRGRVGIEVLFVTTLLGALAASVQSLVTGEGPIYFEVVSVILVVYTVGKTVGARSRRAAVESSRLWAGGMQSARLVDGRGRRTTVPVGQVLPGDRVEVDPGETVPVDGTIETGSGYVSEASVSGEPFAVVRRPGDRVLAGMIAYDCKFEVRATSHGSERQIDRLLRAVEQARRRPTSWQGRVDRISGYFVP